MRQSVPSEPKAIDKSLVARTCSACRRPPACLLSVATLLLFTPFSLPRIAAQDAPAETETTEHTRNPSTDHKREETAEPPSQHEIPVHDESDEAATVTDAAPVPKPVEFLNLRYDEDYSYLEEYPEARDEDPLLYLKNIALPDQWRLDFGGEFRIRAETRTNRNFGLREETTQSQQNYRWMLHANLHYGKRFRVFAQGILAHAENQGKDFQPTQENHGDLHQLFVDINLADDATPLILRLGRQELYYGHDRMVGAFEWVSTRRRFDGIKLFYHTEKWDLDAFVVRPVRVERKGGDDWDETYDFYGGYFTARVSEAFNFDLYVFHSDRSDHTENPNGHTGDRSITTVGTRIWGKKKPWDYDVELAGQWGRWAGDKVEASFFEADVGYTFDHPWYPRLGAGFGWASGDDNPFDRHVGTWDQLFTYDHVCISMQDLIGRQNITRTYVAFVAWPTDRLKTSLFHHFYWLSEDKDFYYDAGGTPLLQDQYGHRSANLGHAVEFQLEYKLSQHADLMAVYSHYWGGRFFDGVEHADDNPDLFFIQFRYRF